MGEEDPWLRIKAAEALASIGAPTMLSNQDGRARGSIGSVYRNLSAEDIKPLLPAIYQAIIEPAPSGEMFADSIRVEGLDPIAAR